MAPESISLAQAIAALGVTGLLGLGIVMFITGKLRRESEIVEAARDHESDILFRETLRQEAISDRRASDDRLALLVAAMKETNDLTRRSLELNERLVEEFVRPTSARTRRTDRVRTDR